VNRESSALALPVEDQERKWLRLALSGSAEAFERLITRHEDAVRAFFWSRTRDHELSEELTQEVFVRAFEGLERFDPDGQFEAWLYGIAHHLELQWRRQQKVQRKALENVAESNRIRKEQSARDSEQPVYQRVLGAIAACPANYHLPLTLRYVDQMTYEEIAALLNLSPGQVKGLLYRGKQMLKERLADLLDGLDESGEDLQ